MCVCVCVYVCVKLLQSYLTLCDSMDYSLTGSSVHRMTLLPGEEQNLRHKERTCENFSSKVLNQKTKGSYIGGFPIILSGA